MITRKIRRSLTILVLLLAAPAAASPALAARPASPWQAAWQAARGLLAPWLVPAAKPSPSAKRAATIGPDGVSSEATVEGKPAGESQGSPSQPVSSS